MLTTIDLIRHGEPVGGSGRYRGQIDDPLSEKGWQQMRAAVADYNHWTAIASSPLSRCAAFAEEMAQRYSLPLSFDERWMEIGFGEWEGRSKEDIAAADPMALHNFYADPVKFSPPGAETLANFEQRIIGAWEAVLQQFAGEHVLLVVHAGVIRMLIRYVLASPLQSVFRINVPNAAISRICIENVDGGASSSLMFHAGVL